MNVSRRRSHHSDLAAAPVSKAPVPSLTFAPALAVAALLLALGPPIASARNIYVASGGSQSVSVVSAAANRAEGAAIQAGFLPIAIAITPDGSRAYVANFFSENVSVINTTTNQLAAEPIGVGRFPDAIAITPDGSRAYVAVEGRGAVAVIDTATNKVEGEAIEVGTEPDAIAITPDGSRAYVLNEGSRSISVIDTATNTVGPKAIKLGLPPRAIAITPDGSRAYVVTGSKSVLVIDTATNTVEGEASGVGSEPVAIAISPDGRRAYVANFGSNDVSVIDTATNQVESETIAVGSKPRAIAISPDGRRAYVADSGSSTVSVVNTATRRAEGEAIEVGSEPRAIAITPDQPSLASFIAPRGRPGVPLRFDASASMDPDSTIASYVWSFGDGQATSLTGPFATYTFAKPGTYQVTLDLTDNEGCSTTLIFTGQTASCNGSASSSQTQTVKVAYPGVRVRCPNSAEPRGCGFKLQAVTKQRKGKAESAVAKARARAGKLAVILLKPKKKFRSTLSTAKMILVKETVTIEGSKRVSFRRLKVVQ